MPTVTEPTLALRFVYALLRADATLTAIVPQAQIVKGEAEQGTAFPRILIRQLTAGPDQVALDGFPTRVWSEPVLLVTVQDEGRSHARIDPAAARLDVLLHGQTYQSVTDGQIVSCFRELGALQRTTFEDNKYFAMIDQQYRLEVRAT